MHQINTLIPLSFREKSIHPSVWSGESTEAESTTCTLSVENRGQNSVWRRKKVTLFHKWKTSKMWSGAPCMEYRKVSHTTVGLLFCFCERKNKNEDHCISRLFGSISLNGKWEVPKQEQKYLCILFFKRSYTFWGKTEFINFEGREWNISLS